MHRKSELVPELGGPHHTTTDPRTTLAVNPSSTHPSPNDLMRLSIQIITGASAPCATDWITVTLERSRHDHLASRRVRGGVDVHRAASRAGTGSYHGCRADAARPGAGIRRADWRYA